MNMIEALRTVANAPELWCRPKRWGKSGMAFCMDSPGWKLVPTHRGGVSAMLPNIQDIEDEWEIVDPNAVCNEQNKRNS